MKDLSLYLSFDEAYQRILSWEKTYPNYVKIFDRNTDMMYVQIGKSNKNFLHCNSLTHAREVATLNGTMFAMESILAFLTSIRVNPREQYYDKFSVSQKELCNIFDQVSILYIPFVNKNGYIIDDCYSINGQNIKGIYWRKNKNGVDLNRNFKGPLWGKTLYYNKKTYTGSSHDPKDQCYHGKCANSEVETRNFINIIDKFHNEYSKIHLALCFHSHGNVILPTDYQEYFPNYVKKMFTQKVLSKSEVIGNALSGATLQESEGDNIFQLNESSTKALGYDAFGTMDQYFTFEKNITAFTVEIGKHFYPSRKEMFPVLDNTTKCIVQALQIVLCHID